MSDDAHEPASDAKTNGASDDTQRTPSITAPPATPDELHRWITANVGVVIVREPTITGHSAPFDYLCHTFFERASDENPSVSADCIVWANRGGGKTFLGAVATLLDLVFKPGIEIRILGGSLEQSARMHAYLRAMLDRPALKPLVAGRITERRIRLTNDSTVELLAQSQRSVRGTRVQKLRCDEIELFDPDVWEAAQLATRSKRCGDFYVRGTIECLSTMHVPYGLMNQLIEESASGRRELFKWSLLDVLEPCDHLPQCSLERGEDCALGTPCAGRGRDRPSERCGHIPLADALTMRSRVCPSTWDAEMLCDKPRRDNCVLPEFDTQIHVIDTDPDAADESLDWLGGMDFGYRSPTVVLWASLSPCGTLTIVDERVKAGVVLDEHIGAIKDAAWPALDWIAVDPAGQQHTLQTGKTDIAQMHAAGVRTKFRRMGVLDGLALVRARLKPADGSAPSLFIHRRCKKLIESLDKYHFDPDRPHSNDPVKDGPDHAVDALRYLVVCLDRPYTATKSYWPRLG
jgi:hypothetical protein